MKNIVLIILFAAFLVIACDPEECGSMVIENKSTTDLALKFFSSGSVIDKMEIETQQSFPLLDKACSMGGPKFIDLSSYDSVQISKSRDNTLIKTYVPSDQDKNILKLENWTRKEKSRGFHVYTFEITQEDIDLFETGE